MMVFLNILLFVLITTKTINVEKQKEIVNKVNKLRTTWKAKSYDRDFSQSFGSFFGKKDIPEKKFQTIKSFEELPINYDLREAYPECETIKEIRDQANCGSCWAFSAAEVMSDRLCIHSNGTLQTRVSALNILSCCTNCGKGCQGGWPSTAFAFWQNYGIPSGGLYNDTKTCQPYTLAPCNHYGASSPDYPDCPEYTNTPICSDQCIENYEKSLEDDKTRARYIHSIRNREIEIMNEIYENGPVTATYKVYEDFITYESGIYQYVTGEYLGGHAVKLIGWGEENGVKYWLVANSWNKYWGDNGFFKILRGEDECGIESETYTGVPLL